MSSGGPRRSAVDMQTHLQTQSDEVKGCSEFQVLHKIHMKQIRLYFYNQVFQLLQIQLRENIPSRPVDISRDVFSTRSYLSKTQHKDSPYHWHQATSSELPADRSLMQVGLL